MEKIAESKCYEGFIRRYKHNSTVLGCEMKFHVYFPPQSKDKNVPILYFLSGLTCTDENFITKAGAIPFASKHGLALVCPDTSPRGLNIPGDKDSYDFGEGAGFYLNATQEPWSKNYKMYDYIVKELPALLKDANLPLDFNKQGIFGHSMGGHGALTIFLKNPNIYKSVSAFAPICHPTSKDCQWGQKALKNYLGDSVEAHKQYDATLLMESYDGPKVPILIDQGADDKFLSQKQLQPEAFEEACKKKDYPLTLRMQEGYDHSYWFIQTFIADHIEHHAKILNN